MADQTVNVKDRGVVGASGQAWVDFDIVGPSSYTSGGTVLTTAQLTALMGYGKLITAVQHISSEENANGIRVALDRATGKIMFFDANSESASMADLDAETVRVRFYYGKISGPGDIGAAV